MLDQGRDAGADGTAHMPSDVGREVGFFDRFAERCSQLFSGGPFFALCVLLAVAWVGASIAIAEGTWQVVVGTLTAILTLLMVALLKNNETRSSMAIQAKLNAVATALAVLMEARDGASPESVAAAEELRHAVGLESHESS